MLAFLIFHINCSLLIYDFLLQRLCVAAIIAPNACLCGAESAAGKVKGTPVVRS